MKRILAVALSILAVIVIVLILHPGGNGGGNHTPAGNSNLEPDSNNLTSQPPSPNPTLNVRIDYIGIKDAGGGNDLYPDDFDGEIQLAIVVGDGKAPATEDQVFIPVTKQGYKMGNFETMQINERVFHTSSVGDYLKVSIIAYDVDCETQTLDLLSAMEMLGAPGAAELRVIIELLPQEDDLVGCYQRTWYKDENWGVGQYREVATNRFGRDNFLVGISIWSDEESPANPEPHLLPDVRILNVATPSQVKQSNSGWFYWKYYTNTVTLVNNEPVDIEVDWKAYSSAEGQFGAGTITVPARGSRSISRSYFYQNDIGPLQLTYRIYYKDRELDSWSGTINVVPGPYS
jgi:hypothetical protein